MNIKLKLLQLDNVTEEYVSWFKNKEVTRYSDNQYRRVTIDSQREYVKGYLNSEDKDLYGIFDENLHLGNISIMGLQSYHKRAELSYMIGNQNYWNKGVASYSISEMIVLANSKYNLKKLVAGTAIDNIGSIKVLKKNGFLQEGIKKNHLLYNNQWYDQIDFGLLLKKF